MNLDGYLDVAVADDAVEFAFRVENAGAASVDLEFRSGAVADAAVYEDDVEVWRWSEGRLFTQAVGNETLVPGESITREMTWRDPDPGEYTAAASLEATDLTLVERAAFTVP